MKRENEVKAMRRELGELCLKPIRIAAVSFYCSLKLGHLELHRVVLRWRTKKIQPRRPAKGRRKK